MIKKILILLLLFCAPVLYADYYDVQWVSVEKDTTTVTTQWNFRGNLFLVYNSTGTDPLIADCTSFIRLYSTGTIEAVDIKASGTFELPFVDTGTTPSKAGIYGRTAQYVVYYSTAADDAASWQKVGAQ